jgi:DNA uptake protein ComE-like DNA-binding protein
MATKIRVNLANPLELLELPGLDAQQVEAIVRFRAEHGPIEDARQLAAILGAPPLADTLLEQADFSPAEATAPEAPGA